MQPVGYPENPVLSLPGLCKGYAISFGSRRLEAGQEKEDVHPTTSRLLLPSGEKAGMRGGSSRAIPSPKPRQYFRRVAGRLEPSPQRGEGVNNIEIIRKLIFRNYAPRNFLCPELW